jgi:hypothetical protein
MAADTNGPGNFCKVGVDREFLSEEAGLRLDGKINLSRSEVEGPAVSLPGPRFTPPWVGEAGGQLYGEPHT